MMAIARPNKIFDARALETWISEYYPDVWSEWELSDAVEWIDFWEWLERGEHYECCASSR